MTDPRISELQALLPRAMTADWVRLGSRLVRLVKDHHHAARHDALLARLLDQARASIELRERRRASVPRLVYPSGLPITARKDEIVQAIRQHQVVVIGGETGSGKTTQLPKMCLEAGLGVEAMVGCTQPRRIAALSISRRVAEELAVQPGRDVGCKVRFDDQTSPESLIKFMTDGILLAELQGDPLLAAYNALIIDEAHERSLNIDFLLGHLKSLLERRRDLRLVITSATIDLVAFAQAFNNAPVIEVSGRVFPVGVVYAPLDEDSEETGDMTIIDAAARATEQVLCEPGDGDVLIFMPGERDIKETADLLRARFTGAAEIIPLFGRLSGAEQQRVFTPSNRRKVIIATNIAETSLTIPNIRFVIDSGLARISRYNARTRTRRLPIEPVAQSSANQRKGRGGRVRDGVCIRLYSEPDFLSRPLFTQPEIQRANLAEVILRMKAWRLGEIETFPFLNPPAPAAIQGGYRLLQELGALDDQKNLTPLGRDLARLPIDPTLGRMLIQAQTEHAARELLIIAAGLSIQDPRERPMEQRDAAHAAHRQFADPASDFLTLLNIWNAVHEKWENLPTQNQRRKFCKTNFLSYLRMREWRDLHAQLESALGELGNLRCNESNAQYDAIHRSILAGLLGHVAVREERNRYKAPGNRQVTLFPGSVLHDKTVRPGNKPGRQRAGPAAPKTSQPEWIVAGEIVETSQLFARTVAGIDPAWIPQLAPHLCKTTYLNPHWSPENGRVVADEEITFAGLPVRRRKVAYGNVNPTEASRIFIRSALVEEKFAVERPQSRREARGAPTSRSLLESVEPETEQLPARFPFLEHNRGIRQKIEIWQTRTRRHDLGNLDDALAAFYAARLLGVSSLDELSRVLAAQGQAHLHITEQDFIVGEELTFDATAFPDQVHLAGQPVPLAYAYKPGEEHDGVTVKLGFSLAQCIPGASVEWAVPGLREAQVGELLRALPKSLRRELMPLPPKIAEILRDLRPEGQSLKHDLARFLRERYGLSVTAASWPPDPLPAHLRTRIEIIDHHAKTLAAGRDLETLRQQVKEPAPPPKASLRGRLAAQWERFDLTTWSIGDLPPRIEFKESDGSTAFAYPGLQLEDDQVNLKIFPAEQLAQRSSLPAIHRLLEIATGKDLAWMQKDLRALARLEPLYKGFTTSEELQADAFAQLKAHLFSAPGPAPASSQPAPFWPLTERAFQMAVGAVRGRVPGLAFESVGRLEPILKLRQELARYGPPPGAAPAPKGPRTFAALADLDLAKPAAPPAGASVIAAELAQLLPRHFLREIAYSDLPNLQRYARALLIRAERARLNPVKDQEKARSVAPYTAALAQLRPALAKADPAARHAFHNLRRAVEEYKISIFAQELGTTFPVSPKRLEEWLQRARAALG